MLDSSCDGCGKKTTCPEGQPAPEGWFYIPFDNDGAVLACSKKCTRTAWKQNIKVDATASTEPPP